MNKEQSESPINTGVPLDLYDASRDRAVPVMLYRPPSALGWILFSVGYGGTRAGYAYLGRAWARAGFAVAVVEHVGSNLEILKSFPQKSRAERNAEVLRRVQEEAESTARPHDLAFVRRTLGEQWNGLPLGLGGHSYGSYTVLANLGLPARVCQQELPFFEGVNSALLASPEPPGRMFPEDSYQQLTIPTLVLTGDKDELLDGSSDYRARQKVFELLPAETGNLVVMKDVDHMMFAGVGLGVSSTLSVIGHLTARWWELTLLGCYPSWRRAQELSQTLQAAEAVVE